MSVPAFQSFLLPLLRVLADGREQSYRDVFGAMQTALGVSDADMGELLPSKRLTRFESRVYWAATYLDQAGLIAKPTRGRLRITERGASALATSPDRIDKAFLMRYPEFAEFARRGRPAGNGPSPDTVSNPAPDDVTPEEALEAAHLAIRESVVRELHAKLAGCTPKFFERLVVDLLEAMGFGAGKVVGGTGDGGIDGVIQEDKLGLDIVYLQAKRWSNTVQRSTVHEFAGSLESRRASKGVLITTSTFSTGAQDTVKVMGKRIVLIDGARLAELMIDHGIGVTEVRSYVVKRIDNDYFEEP